MRLSFFLSLTALCFSLTACGPDTDEAPSTAAPAPPAEPAPAAPVSDYPLPPAALTRGAACDLIPAGTVERFADCLTPRPTPDGQQTDAATPYRHRAVCTYICQDYSSVVQVIITYDGSTPGRLSDEELTDYTRRDLPGTDGAFFYRDGGRVVTSRGNYRITLEGLQVKGSAKYAQIGRELILEVLGGVVGGLPG